MSNRTVHELNSNLLKEINYFAESLTSMLMLVPCQHYFSRPKS
jgi:hypothetical protein